MLLLIEGVAHLMPDPVTTVAKLFTSISDTLRTYFERKAEMYEVHLKKKRKKALDLSEEIFEDTNIFINWVYSTYNPKGEQRKEYESFVKKFKKGRRKFNKLD